MMGVTYFLSPASVHNTLKSIANIAVAGSEVVFDYSTQKDINPKSLSSGAKFFKRLLSKFGESIQSGFDPLQ